MAQIGDTLTEGGAARVNTHIRTGQTVLRPSALIGALNRIGALGATTREQGSKGVNQDDA
jgi:hypothetical protein